MISVLYIDDEPDLLELCKLFLEGSDDFKVDTLQWPLKVMSHLEKNQYDAIICDYQMPDLDGIGLLKKIRAISNDTPFILFTGRGREEIVIEALNNGADFYLQKGGDTGALFTELISKVRQAVMRRQAQHSLRESEKLLFDIINFLPDATFAINRSGTVISWNKAIEEMTGIPARDMLGRKDYEYAIPFYGKRRPILIDLIFEPDEKIRTDYTGITREKDRLTAVTSLPRPKGIQKTLMGVASPLYNETGQIVGSIESIRDITVQNQAESELRAAHEQLTASDEELRSQLEELVRIGKTMQEKEELFQEITTTIPGVAYQYYARPDGSHGMYYVSERSRDILGLEPSASPFFERFTAQVHPDDRANFLSSVADATSKAEKWHFEGRFFKPTGEMIWFQGVSNPAFHENELVFSGVIFDISDRKISEDALKDEEMRYRTLVEHSQDPVFVIQDGNIVFANEALFKMASRAESELIGHSLWDIIAPEDKERVIATNRERMSGKTAPDSYEFSLLRSDGKTRVRVKVNVGLVTYRGKPATLGTFHDITTEREREDALKRSEQKYRELTDLLPQIVFEMDAGLNVTYANRHALASLGLTREDVDRGINALDYIDPSQHAIVEENVKKSLRGEPYESPEYTAIRKDCSTFPVLIYASPIYQNGDLTGFRGIIVDISAWKTAATAQRECEDRYTTLADAAQDLIYIIDRNDTVLYVNNFGQQMLMKGRGEIIGKPRKTLFPEEASARQYQNLQRVFTTGMPLRVESRIPLPSRDTWQDTHLVPLRSADGTITSVMGISRDITQLKQADIALKRSNEKLNLLNSITRHDVANQLTILNGYIQLALMKEPGTVVLDFLKKIESTGNTIQRQIEFTRAYQDLGIRAPDWFRLDQVIAKTKPAGLVFTELCKDYEIFADPMLEKVFFNLFDNAIRHGEHVTSILARCDRVENELVIIVEDDGTGIPLDEKPKIFRKGFGKNTGYGLFLVREILAITNIEIHETGRHGSGARFEITVPRGGWRKAAVKPIEE